MSTSLASLLVLCAAASEPTPAAPQVPAAPEAPAAPPAAASAAPAPAWSEASPLEVAAAAPADVRAPLLRIVVQEVEVPPGQDRLQRIFTSSLVTEVRKLAGVSVVGLDEVRALIDITANRQLAGCDDVDCTSELADALGAGVVVNARLSTLGDENIVAFRRLDAASGQVKGVDRRFAKADGEEFLAAIGPAVAELFPELALRPGAARGVDKEVALKLNPPPLAPWTFFTMAAGSGVALAAGGAAGALSSFFEQSAEDKIARSVVTVVDAADVKRDADAAATSALVANVAFLSGGVLLASTAAAWFFTDFAGHADAP